MWVPFDSDIVEAVDTDSDTVEATVSDADVSSVKGLDTRIKFVETIEAGLLIVDPLVLVVSEADTSVIKVVGAGAVPIKSSVILAVYEDEVTSIVDSVFILLVLSLLDCVVVAVTKIKTSVC